MAEKNKQESERLYTQSEMDDAIAKVAAKVVEEAGPTLLAAALQMQGKAAQQAGTVRAGPPPQEQCECCKQLKVACGGVPPKKNKEGAIVPFESKEDMEAAYSVNHRKIVVYPQRFPMWGPWFQGFIMNGVKYLSNNGNHGIWVPKDAVGGALHHVQAFEDNETATRVGGRTKEWDSGSINNPNVVNPVTGGFR